MNHSSVRVYGNSECVINVVRDEHLEDHIKYNTTMRFGCMLFIDGKCVYTGVYKKEYADKYAAEWEEKIKNMNININNPTPLPYR